MADKSQQTEKATPRRVDKARKEGNFPAAKDFVSAVQFITFVAILGSWGGRWFSQTQSVTRYILQRAFTGELSATAWISLCWWVAVQSVMPLLLAGAILLTVTLAMQLLASKLGVSLAKLTPDLKRLSFMSKIRELPKQNLPALIQAVILLPVFGYVVYAIAKSKMTDFFFLPLQSVQGGVRVVASSIQELLWRGATTFLVFGLVNLFRQRLRYAKDLRMSKNEIKDEAKETDGNPQIKQRVRRLQRDLRRRNMMKEVATATAVVVNPTHYAIAIRYQMESMAAPLVVAKGKNYLALRIRTRAIENQVPIIENPLLAQALYKSVDVGQEIPAHLYRAVAEILAYIYRLMHGKMPGR